MSGIYNVSPPFLLFPPPTSLLPPLLYIRTPLHPYQPLHFVPWGIGNWIHRRFEGTFISIPFFSHPPTFISLAFCFVALPFLRVSDSAATLIRPVGAVI